MTKKIKVSSQRAPGLEIIIVGGEKIGCRGDPLVPQIEEIHHDITYGCYDNRCMFSSRVLLSHKIQHKIQVGNNKHVCFVCSPSRLVIFYLVDHLTVNLCSIDQSST